MDTSERIACFAGAAGNAAYPVMVGHLDFRRIFDADYLGFRRNEGGEGVHQGGFTGSGFSGYPDVHAFLENQGKVSRHIIVKRAELDKLQDA